MSLYPLAFATLSLDGKVRSPEIAEAGLNPSFLGPWAVLEIRHTLLDYMGRLPIGSFGFGGDGDGICPGEFLATDIDAVGRRMAQSPHETKHSCVSHCGAAPSRSSKNYLCDDRDRCQRDRRTIRDTTQLPQFFEALARYGKKAGEGHAHGQKIDR